MAEEKDSQDQSQKTEEATAHRLKEAREKGQIALSREVNHWMVILAILLITATFSPYLLGRLATVLMPFLVPSQFSIHDASNISAILSELFGNVSKVAFIPFLAILIAGASAGLAQTKFLISIEHIKPKFSKISPLAGIKRMFSAHSLIEFLKGLFKITVIGAILFYILYPELRKITYWGTIPVNHILPAAQTILIKILIAVLAIMGVIAIADYFFQRFNYLRQLRMSKQDIKDEYKETEGDPLIKRRLAEIRREKAQRQRLTSVMPEATVVITNPTHYAVVLKYDPETMDAPKCVAKGADLMAQRIREMADEHNVPILEDPPLARALYSGAELDQEIPTQYYFAVARVVRYIMGLDKQYRATEIEG